MMYSVIWLIISTVTCIHFGPFLVISPLTQQPFRHFTACSSEDQTEDQTGAKNPTSVWNLLWGVSTDATKHQTNSAVRGRWWINVMEIEFSTSLCARFALLCWVGLTQRSLAVSDPRFQRTSPLSLLWLGTDPTNTNPSSSFVLCN